MKKAWLALVFGSAIFLAACGGGDEATDTGTNTDTTTEQTNTTDEDTTNDNATDGTEQGTTDDGATDQAAADGQAVVQKNCISCHGQNLEGMGSFPALNNVGSRLSEEEILNVIQNGQGGMPPNIVQGDDAKAAAAYLATLK